MQPELTDAEFDRLVLTARPGRTAASVTRAVDAAHGRFARRVDAVFSRVGRLLGMVTSYGWRHRALGTSAPKHTRFTDDDVIATATT